MRGAGVALPGARTVRGLLNVRRMNAKSRWSNPARWLERVVGAEVLEGEGRLVLLFFANLFLLLAAYYILKVIREPLILLGGGAVRRAYARGAQAGILVVLIPLYSALANRFEPARLVERITAVFAVSLVLFFVAKRAGLTVGFAFFIWLGIFSTLSIAQFWSLANDVMTEPQGKRLFPLIAVGGTAGGIAGAQFAARAFRHLSPEAMMLVAAGLLLMCMLLTAASHGHRGPTKRREAPADRRGGFTLVLSDRYLFLIALSVVALNLITATGDFVVAQLVTAKANLLPAAERGRFIGAFYGDLQTWITAATTLAQILVVARVFKAIGVAGALFIMPIMLVSGYGLFALLPLLSTVTVLRVAEGTADYSLQNTIQHALFLPTSRDAKYKAKSAIDTLSKRVGDLGSTAIVFAGTTWAAWGVRGFAIVNAVLAVLWIVVSSRLARRLRALTPAAPQPATGQGAPAPLTEPQPRPAL